MSRRFGIGLVAAIALAIASANLCALPTVVIVPDEPESQDAWAYQFTPNTDQNVDFYSVLVAGETGPASPHDLESYLRFNLSPYTLGGNFVQSASLSLFVIPSEQNPFGASPSDAFPLSISAYEVTGPWSEALTWNTRPPRSTVATSTVTLNSASIENWVQFDVTTLATKWLDNPTTNHGLAVIAEEAVRDAMGNAVIAALHSSSAEFKPTLTIQFNATPGDANLDGKVDVTDLGTLATHWQASSGVTWQDGDFDANGMIDITDLGLLATNWQVGAGAMPEFSSLVPEPAGLGFLTIVAVGLGRRNRLHE